MNSYYGLSEIEYELMQLFWQSGKELFFAEIVRYCNEQKGHDWAQTTIHTYLSRLIQKNVLTSSRKGYKRSYKAKVSEEELSGIWANKFIETSYGNSVTKFLVSFTQKTKLSKEEIDHLHQFLDEQLPNDDSSI